MSTKGNYEKSPIKGNLKAIKGGCSNDVKGINVDCEEVKPEQKKEVVLVGFDRIAGDHKKKLEKLARQKGISSFSILGIPTREGVPRYSGGMVGNPEILVEGLYNMANQRPEIKALLEITVNALREAEVLKITSLPQLNDKGKLKPALFSRLSDEGIHDLRDLAKKSIDEVAEYRNVGEQSLKELTKLLEERGMSFAKTEPKKSK